MGAALRERISVLRPSGGPDGYGNVTTGPLEALVENVWASVEETGAGETVVAGAVHAGRKATVIIPATALNKTIVESDSIQMRGGLWDILSIVPYARRMDMLEITAAFVEVAP